MYMQDSIIISSSDSILHSLNFKPYRSKVERRVIPFMPMPNEVQSMDIKTPWGAVRLKVASLNGSVANFAPEYEDCRRIAARRRLPLKAVMQEAVRAYLERANG